MSLKLCGYLFTGPFPLDTTIRANQQPAVFAVIDKGGPAWAPIFRVIDVGFSEESGIVFADHPSRAQWTAASGRVLGIYLFYAARSQYSMEDRKRIASEVRQKYDPPNGIVEA